MIVLITEGIAGRWHYHLREAGKLIGPALCGAEVMHTSIPLTYWNKTPKNYHLPEKWCEECATLAGLEKK
jgi:hypothetical protein